MQGSDGFERFVEAGFELLGIEADKVELRVVGAADSLYRPRIDALIEADLDGVDPEPDIDLSRPPER